MPVLRGRMSNVILAKFSIFPLIEKKKERSPFNDVFLNFEFKVTIKTFFAKFSIYKKILPSLISSLHPLEFFFRYGPTNYKSIFTHTIINERSDSYKLQLPESLK